MELFRKMAGNPKWIWCLLVQRHQLFYIMPAENLRARPPSLPQTEYRFYRAKPVTRKTPINMQPVLTKQRFGHYGNHPGVTAIRHGFEI